MTASQWFYLSFADDTGWLGGAYVPGNTAAEALISAWANDCNPGGEAKLIGPLPAALLDEYVATADRCRLLTRGEMETLDEVQPWR